MFAFGTLLVHKLEYYVTGTAASAYNVSSIPVTVFIDAQGKVRKSQVGAMSEIVLKSYVAELLKQGE